MYLQKASAVWSEKVDRNVFGIYISHCEEDSYKFINAQCQLTGS